MVKRLLYCLLLLLPGALSAQTMAHRYSFFAEPDGSLVATDSIAAANGSLEGSAAITGGRLVLNGNSGTYLALPSDIINTGSPVTVETWANFGALPQNCFFWGFGNTDSGGSGEDYLFCAPQAGRIAITGTDPGYTGEQNAASGVNWSSQTNFHIVAVYDPPAGYLSLYTNGVLAAANTNVTTPLADVKDMYNYIGRSLYTADPYAPLSVSEFRIWEGALTAQQIALDAASGPAQIVDNPGTLVSVQIQAANQMLAGATQPAAVLGNFANATNVNLFTYGHPVITSDNTNVLSVSASGLVTAITPDASANIIATYDGLTATQNIAVTGFATNQFVYNSFGDGFWTILNAGNSHALVAGFNGATQETFTNGATEQQFEVLYNLQSGSFRLRQHSSWYCLGASNNVAGAGRGATLIPFYTGTTAQQWYLVNAGGGYYRIFNAASNLVLQTDNGTPANVTLAAVSASPFQLWQFAYQTHYPKKGCAGYEGDYAQFGLAWAYNYDDNTGTALPANVAFEPMIWGPYWEPLSNVQSYDNSWLASPKPGYLMTFNEPDNSGQADMSTNTAISMWPALENLNLPLVSPAMQNTFDGWAYNFFDLIAANHYRVDYTAVHLYVPPNSTSLINELNSVYTIWGRPVWLTEFSPVDWNGNQGWTEDDDYNFLAEFLWMAEGQEWLKRYAIFPFSGTNSLPPWQSTTAGYRGNFFQADGATLTPYGELYAAWDGNTNLQAATPYFIHNLGTSFRLISTNSSTPQSADIYAHDVSAQWAMLPAPTTNHWYIISLKDGRRLSDTLGALTLAQAGTTGQFVEWTFTGPDSQGYYYIGNPFFGHNLNGAGTPPAITFTTVSSSTLNNNTRWRLVKPYQPASISLPTVPASLSAAPGNQNVVLTWAAGDAFYNVYRGTNSGGPYAKIAGVLTNTAFTDNTVVKGTEYFYVVTGLNLLSQESGYSPEAGARPVSTSSTRINFAVSANLIQFNWAADHTGWELQMQTNAPGMGLGTNWVTVAGSGATNTFSLPVNSNGGNVFYRLVYP